MSKFELKNNMTRTFYRTGLKAKKYTPEILVGFGIVCGIAAGVKAAKATMEVDAALADTRECLKKAHKEVEENGYSETYTEEDHRKNLALLYAKGGLELAKIYGSSVMLEALSVTSILCGHNMLRKRNLAITAAYAAIDQSFKEYRGRVVERFGKELDRELRYNIQKKEVEEIVTNEDGTETTEKVTVNTVNTDLYSDYAKFFDSSCEGWTKDPEYNLTFLKNQQRYANDLLKSRGHVFLNEVYDMLGIQRTEAGAVVGWLYDEKYPVGDNYIDFGIYDINNSATRRFVNGIERDILLEFNVDGPIWNKI